MNTMKTFLLLAVLTALFGGAGYALGGEKGMVIALLMTAAMGLFAYWNADRLILSLYRAHPLSDGPIVRIVRELAADAKRPMPRVYIIDTQQPNAFAAGRNPGHAAVAVTRGLLDVLDEREIKAVLAHEMTHPATAHLFIVNPLPGGGLGNLFATHPPMNRRIEILRQLARRPS